MNKVCIGTVSALRMLAVISPLTLPLTKRSIEARASELPLLDLLPST